MPGILMRCAVLAVLLLADAATGQLDWQRNGRLRGAAISDAAAAYDSIRGETVLFGGLDEEIGRRNATWTWRGRSWDVKAPLTSPGARHGHAMAFDRGRGVTVLFGGWAGAELGDTWEWDGNTWTQRRPATAPAARGGHALAYDDGRGVTVLFGGLDASGQLFGDTWEWDGITWTQRRTPQSPVPTYDHCMAFDSVRQRTVMFGGYNAVVCPTSCPLTNSTWEYDGATWQRAQPIGRPAPTAGAAMAWHADRGRIVLLGGRAIAFPPLSRAEVWEYDGTRWRDRRVGPRPGTRWDSVMVYDDRRRRLVVAGGYTCGIPECFSLGETWEGRSAAPAGYDDYGAGCTGSAGSLELTSNGALPWRGDTMTLVLGPVAAAPAIGAVGILGSSATAWGAFTLPFALDALGAPGCSLLTGAEVIVPLGIQAGAATWRLEIPETLAPGLSFHAQGILLGDPINPGRIVTSNGGEAVTGAR